MDMLNNIFVHSGAQLHITAKIGMRQGTRIHVGRNARLYITHGGVVTTGCGASEWAGIQVLGNSQMIQPEHDAPLDNPDQAGIVWIQGGKTETAQRGVFAGGQPSDWGGVVWVDTAQFILNKIDAEFLPYKFATNKSRFKNAIFSEVVNALQGSRGVVIQGTDGIEFDNCGIFSKDLEGIRTIDAGIKVS